MTILKLRNLKSKFLASYFIDKTNSTETIGEEGRFFMPEY